MGRAIDDLVLRKFGRSIVGKKNWCYLLVISGCPQCSCVLRQRHYKGETIPQLKGPHQGVGVHHLKSRGHTKVRGAAVMWK